MSRTVLILGFLLGCTFADSLLAASPLEVPIWPEKSAVLAAGIKEIAKVQQDHPFAITHPTFLVYPPTAPSVHSAVIVFPGGGFKVVAIGVESTLGPDGVEVCKLLTDVGITCFLVKYRVPYTGCHRDAKTRKHVTPAIPMALQDAQRTISMVRFDARKYDIEPNKVGVMGFSAGGNLAVLTSTAFNKRAYAPIDAVDEVSSRPDFAIPVYPGHMTMEHKNKVPRAVAARELNTDIEISKDIPPTLLVHAKDDTVDPVHYSEVYARELRKAGAPVQLNIYQTGGHAFGVRKSGKDADRWTADALAWLKEIKILAQSGSS